jgi:hypothetical protein
MPHVVSEMVGFIHYLGTGDRVGSSGASWFGAAITFDRMTR